MSKLEYQPRPGETLGTYLKRLRAAAGRVQDRPVTQEEVAGMTARLPAPQRFTTAWLSVAESDGYKHAGGDKLRTLASIYSRLLRETIPAQWLLVLAGHDVVELAPPHPNNEALDRLLRHEDVLALVAAAGKLVEMGHPGEVRLLAVMAQRYINARDPQAKIGDIFNDPVLSAHLERWVENVGLT